MSAQSQWHAIDALIEGTLLDHDPALKACLSRSREAGLPDIAGSAAPRSDSPADGEQQGVGGARAL